MGRAEADQTVAHAHGLYGLYGLTGTGSTGFTGSRALLPHHYCIPQASSCLDTQLALVSFRQASLDAHLRLHRPTPAWAFLAGLSALGP